MLGITKQRCLLPQKGNSSDCSQRGKRVTSAACEDGHATAPGGASRNKQTSRHPRIRRPCSRSSLSHRLMDRSKSGSLSSKRNHQTRPSCKRANQRNPKPVKPSHSSSGATAIAVADAADAAIAKRPRSRRRFLGREVRLAKLPKLKSRRSLPSRLPNPHRRPSSRRAPWCCRLAFRDRVRALGSNVTIFFPCRATWCAFCCSTT